MSLLYVGKILGWFKYEVSLSIELMRSFINGVEIQAQESIVKYNKEKKTHVLEEYSKENYREVETHQGLDSETVDLEDIFCKFFPSLQRSSAFLTLYAFFEKELNNLCYKCKKEKLLNISYSDLKGTGIKRSIKYLKKLVGINICKESKAWQQVDELRLIRNHIVHEEGKLNEKVKNILHQMSSVVEYSNNEIILKKGFLNQALNQFESYFKLLDQHIQSSFLKE